MLSKPVLGIDLGTTNSCVAVFQRGKHRVLENAEGARTTPSVVSFPDAREVLVGAAAKRQWITNAPNTVFAAKRLIGRRADDPLVARMQSSVPYAIVPSERNGDCAIRLGSGKVVAPAEISAHVLGKMRDTAALHLGSTKKGQLWRSVVTCPAYFNDAQRQATKDAGRIAGLDVVRVINEPTAAALAYGLSEKDNGKVVCVFDLGGGTFDVSILEISGGVFEVKATNGDTFLGGEDFDNALVKHFIDNFRSKHPDSKAVQKLAMLINANGALLCKKEFEETKMAFQRVKEAAERAKIDLSSSLETEVNLPFLCMDEKKGPLHLQQKINRATYEALTSTLVKRTMGPVKKCLQDAKIRAKDVSDIVLVGGMTRAPNVLAEVTKVFGKEPFRGCNPDEAVAVGAAIQGGIIDGSVKSVVLLDVTPLSLGIETVGGVFTKIIDRNTTIPSRRSQMFATVEDFQKEVEVKVFQGERAMAKDNKMLGKFVLTGIPPLPRGQVKVDVTFDIDANGIVHVNAKDQKSGKEQSIRIENASGLSEAEIEKIIQQAEALRDDDTSRKERAEAVHSATSFVRTTKDSLKEYRKRMTLASVSQLEKEIAAVEEAIKSEKPAEEINQLVASLKDAATRSFSALIVEDAKK